jgi:glycosyltransferase involved in cell wall biosynthesis
MAGRLSGVPTVYTPHGLIITSAELSGLQASMYTWMERILGYLGTSKVIADSQDERRFIEKSALIPAGRIAVIQNGMDEEHIEYFSTDMACEAISEQRPLTLGSTMRFEAEKAPNYLVEAFVELRAMLPHIPMQLVIAGDGKLFDVVERQARASGVGEKISFLGWRTNIKEVLRGLDIFVVPSLREAGLSYSTMEAMAAKLPIISTNVFGAKETLSRVSGNLLVPAGDPDALAHAMKRMATLTDSGLLRLRLREIGQANQAHIRAHFKQSETASRTLQLYQALSWP